MKRTISLFLCALLISSVAFSVPIHKGEKIKLLLKEALSSQSSHVGDQVMFEVGDDVKSGDKVVIAKGADAYGEVQEVVPAKGMGRAGKLNVKGLYVSTVDGRKLRITFNNSENPGGSQGWVWASAILLTPLSLFFKGSAAEIKKGTEINAFLDEDADVLTSAEKKEQERPHLSIIGGKEQTIRSSSFLFTARIDNAQHISAVRVDGNPVSFTPGNVIDIATPVTIQNKIALKTEIPISVQLDDGLTLSDSITISRDSAHSWKGKILKADIDGIFINIGGLNGLTRNTCFTVYKQFVIRDADGHLVEKADSTKGYVRVLDVFDKTAKVEPTSGTMASAIRVNDLIK